MPTFSRRLRPQQRSRLTPNENLGTGDHPLACCVPPPRCMLHHHPSPVLPPNHKVFTHEVYPHKALHHVVSTQHVHFSTSYISITTHTQSKEQPSIRRKSTTNNDNDNDAQLRCSAVSCSADPLLRRLDILTFGRSFWIQLPHRSFFLSFVRSFKIQIHSVMACQVPR